MAKINPLRGNKRPTKEVTLAAGGKFSAKQIHAVLTTMNNAFESFLADKENTEGEEDVDSPDSMSD